MPHRRYLALWFPRLGAERWLRLDRRMPAGPLAAVTETNGRQLLASLSAGAEAAGLARGQTLGDALAICPALLTRPSDPRAEADFLAALARQAGRFSPFVGLMPPEGLVIDLTGAAHLFGGEAAVMGLAQEEAMALGLTARAGLADTPGAAWALAGHAGSTDAGSGGRSGDAIDQEARATRARAARRRPPVRATPAIGVPRIAAPGETAAVLAPLPLAALRLEPDLVEGLGRLGLRRIGDLIGLPRAPLARRFGPEPGRRLDQALGLVPEPISPLRAPDRFALRLSLPEPIGLLADLEAAVERLLPPLCERLARAGRGARRLRLEVLRTDRERRGAEIGLARPAADPDRIRPLLRLKLDGIDAGPGIDTVRLEAVQTEPVHARGHRGHLDASARAEAARHAPPGLDDLIGRLGARIGMEAVTRLHPADSHIPEKTAQVLTAAWSAPAASWPRAPRPRPLRHWPPEPITTLGGTPPEQFRWRRRDLLVAAATGPERIAPEWWLDDPAWRSGLRDYWQVVTADGLRLWIYLAHGGVQSGGWFCQGSFD